MERHFCDDFVEDEVEGLGLFKHERIDDGDQAMGAVKPWLGNTIAPTGFVFKKSMASPPEENLKLEYAHGYRGFDTRMNLKFTRNPKKIVYSTAALGVVLDKSANT
jgi:hypothetical protein